ncbi:uncharacterized protein LOC143185096 [Calliopsis andreniformis]|uniref:uncharacterized protein LOC143185096 n=1 Tax=Calliopsis andreniformis TaxID=337506 RepID=UPI003FCC8B88
MSNKTSENSSNTKSSIEISNSVFQRLEHGVSDEEKSTTTDNFWINKVATIDEEHTKNNGLDISEVDKLLREVSQYVTPKSEHGCPIDASRVSIHSYECFILLYTVSRLNFILLISITLMCTDRKRVILYKKNNELKAAECLKDNKGDTLTCAREVETFTKCIDKLLYEVVRKDLKDSRTKKKETFTETFERQFQL